MAESVVTITVDKEEALSSTILAVGTIAVAAGDYATGGLPLTFVGKVKSASANNPHAVMIQGKSGFLYEADLENDKFIIRQQKDPGDGGGADIPLTELAAAAAPAAVVADVIRFWALFKKFV